MEVIIATSCLTHCNWPYCTLEDCIADYGQPFNHMTPTGFFLFSDVEFAKKRIEEQAEYIARYRGTREDVIESAMDILEMWQEKYLTLVEPNNHTNGPTMKGGEHTIGNP